jgi:hypothetical protein
MLESLKNEKLTPMEIVSSLKSIPLLTPFYETKVRHYTLEDHTMLVIGQFDRYFKNTNTVIPKNLFRLLLALHDIGKPKAFLEGNIHNQYKDTIEIVSQIRPQLPYNKESIDLCLSIVNGDPIGSLFQDKISTQKSAALISQMRTVSNLEAAPFFKILTIYYQCDAASYTQDAGGIRFLEHLFVYEGGQKMLNVPKSILKFSPIFEAKYSELEKAIK